MSAAVMTARHAETSPLLPGARMAGFFWLMTIFTGTFALLSYNKVVVPADAATTAANLVAHEPFFRLGVVSDLVALVCYLTATILVYRLLKPVNANLSLLAAFFSLAGCAISGVSFVFRLSSLVMLSGEPYLNGFTVDQLRTLAIALLRIGAQGSNFNFAFFGLHCLLVGYLILRSTFMPRIVGGLMAFGGLGWLTMSLANLLSPAFGLSLYPYSMIPGSLGELTLTLWLLVMGVNAPRWNEQAIAAREW